MDVFEAMGTARAMRFFRPDPVPDELLERVLWGATRASNPNNTQAWHFVVVRDPEQRRRIGDVVQPFSSRVAQMPDPGNETDRRTLKGARNLSGSLGDVPVLVYVCGRNVYPAHQPQETMMYSAIYAASQNLVVAARAVGLGAAFTTLHQVGERQMRDILGIPDDVFIGTLIPLGYPDGPEGPVTRRPLDEVVHYDRW
jgi:nitroreductase